MIDKIRNFRRIMYEWYYEGIELIFNMFDRVPPRWLYYDQLRWSAEWEDSE